jgi:chromosome partitioning protein
MAFIIAVANLKGGCGKSSIAVNLASELAGTAPVVLVDADVQGTATHHTSGGDLPIRAEHLPLSDERVDTWGRRVLALDAEYIVIDCPPQIGLVTDAAIGISDLVLIPCTPSTADLLATVSAVDLVRAARGARNDGGPKCLLVPSRVDTRTVAGRDIEAALKKFKEPVGPVIHQRAAFVDCFSANRSIGDHAPGGSAHRDIQALATRVRKML